MIDPIGDTGSDHAEIIGDLGMVGEPIGDPESTFTVLLPGSLRCEKRGVGFSHCRDRSFKAVREALSGELVQERFWIKEIEVAGSALHEEPDHVLGLTDTMRNLGAYRIGSTLGGTKKILTCQRGKCDGAKSGSGTSEKFSPGMRMFDSIAGHGERGVFSFWFLASSGWLGHPSGFGST
jgi:hypothetical protein